MGADVGANVGNNVSSGKQEAVYGFIAPLYVPWWFWAEQTR